MKRLLLATGVFVLVLAGCGGSHKSAATSESHPRAVRIVDRAGNLRIEERKRAAGRDAERLLRRLVLPPGARRISQQNGSADVSTANVGVNIFTQYVYRHAFWQVPEKASSVEEFLRQHRPPGFTLGASGGRPVTVEYASRPVRGRIGQGHIMVTLGSVPGFTVIRADAGSAWTYPRSPREVVPAGVREIDVRSGPLQTAVRRAGAKPVARRVTNPREVARIVRWFDALNVVQPRTMVMGCVLVLQVPVRFVFRSANGTELASALAPSVPASSCETIQFTIHGQRQTPLIDSTPDSGQSFVERVQRLLGVRFVPRDAHL